MPIYEYYCDKCGKELETWQPYNGAAPLCCDNLMKRKVSSPSIVAIKDKGGTIARSKGYKEGYSREYLKDIQT